MPLGVGLNRSRSSRTKFPGVRNFSTSHTSDSITLNWDPPASGTPTSYEVEINGGDQQTVTPPTTTYTYSGLSAGSYTVRVRVVYADGNSGWTQSGAIALGSASLDFSALGNSQYIPLLQYFGIH